MVAVNRIVLSAVLSLLFIFAQQNLLTAQAQERLAYVSTPESSIYCGPFSTTQETLRLAINQKVRIHHEEGDFYAIQPPAGSISWVRAAYLRFATNEQAVNLPCAAVIDANNQAMLRPGRINYAAPLNYEKNRLADGTLVTVIGKKVSLEGINWYPISSPEDEFRYIAKNKIRFDMQNPTLTQNQNQLQNLSLTQNQSNQTLVNIASTTANNANISLNTTRMPYQGWSHPTWLEAQNAEKELQLDRAEKLYLELAREMIKPRALPSDGEKATTTEAEKLAEDCYGRVHEIREKRRKMGLPAGQFQLQNDTNGNKNMNPGERISSTSTALSTQNQQPTQYQNQLASRTKPDTESASKATSNQSNNTSSDDSGRWEGPGVLYASALRLNGQKVYALQTTPDHVIAYLVSTQNVDLSKYVGKMVRTFGVSSPLTGYPDKQLMQVSQLADNPE